MYANASQKDVYNWCKQRFFIVLYTVDDLVNQLLIERKVMYTNASQKDVYNWCKQRFSIVLYTVDDLVNQLPIHLSLYI